MRAIALVILILASPAPAAAQAACGLTGTPCGGLFGTTPQPRINPFGAPIPRDGFGNPTRSPLDRYDFSTQPEATPAPNRPRPPATLNLRENPRNGLPGTPDRLDTNLQRDFSRRSNTCTTDRSGVTTCR